MRHLLLRLASISRTAKAATLAGLIGLPLLGALIYAIGPSEIWFGGPNSPNANSPSLNSPSIDADARPQLSPPQERQLVSAGESDAPQPTSISRNLRVASGDTLMAMLTNAGIARQKCAAAAAPAPHFCRGIAG